MLPKEVRAVPEPGKQAFGILMNSKDNNKRGQ